MPTSPFEYFVGHQNQQMVRLLESNHEVSEFFLALLQHMVDYANHKGKPFSEIKVDHPFITTDGYLKARLL